MNLLEFIDNININNSPLQRVIFFNNFLLKDNNNKINIYNLLESYKKILLLFNINPIDDDILINYLKCIYITKHNNIPLLDNTNSIIEYNKINYINYIYKKYIYINKFNSIKLFTLLNSYRFSKKNKLLLIITLIEIIIIIVIIYYNYRIINNYLLIARISAFLILINIFFILIQYSDITNYLPENIMIYLIYSDKSFFHSTFGIKVILFSSIHSIAHFTNINYILKLCKYGCKRDNVSLINYHSNNTIFISKNYFNKTLPFISGYILLCLCIIFIIGIIKIYIYGRPSIFLITHRILFILFSIVIIIHGSNQLLGFNFSYIFILPLFIIYLIFRYPEFTFSRKLKIKQWEIVNNKLIQIYLEKENYILLHRKIIHPSYALFINSPSISLIEWHPFTVSSCYTYDEYILNIDIIGDWTQKLHEQLKNNITMQDINLYIGRYKLSSFRFHIFYKTNIYICSNLGITPYLSLMRDIITSKKMDNSYNYFIWSINNLELLSMISTILNEINANFNIPHIKIYIYYSDKNNIKLMNLNEYEIINLLFLQTLIYEYIHIDIISNLPLPNILILGRFNINNFLTNIINNSKKKSNIGVFICGGNKYCNIIKNIVNTYSNNSKKIQFDCWIDTT
jgi:predicted ferric reductase